MSIEGWDAGTKGCLSVFSWSLLILLFAFGTCIMIVTGDYPPDDRDPPAVTPEPEPWTPPPPLEPYEPPPIKPKVVLPEPVVFRYRSDAVECPVTIDVEQVMDLTADRIRLHARFRAQRAVTMTRARSGWADWEGSSELNPGWAWELPDTERSLRSFPPEGDRWVLVVDGVEYELRPE